MIPPAREPIHPRGHARTRIRALWTVALAIAAAVLTASPAAAATYAAPSVPGPPLDVPLAQLQASLQCEPSVRDAQVEPVLLNPATGVTAQENYSWNWEPALDKLGIPWCAYTAPHSTLDNIETSGEYLVYAIRTMYGMAGRKIAIMGHSQGGMSMRWALRFWPDTRAMVDDVIGFSGSNHGTTVLSPTVCATGCPPADWQQGATSQFIQALNSDAETFPAISYTEIYTHTDEVVQPAGNSTDASAALHTGAGMITNVATQDICPLDTDEHLMIGTIDPVAYALAVDALEHPGPADPARIPASVCSQLLMPGVNPATLDNELQILMAAPGLASVELGAAATATTGAPVMYAEPPLACYVFAGCPASGVATVLAASEPASACVPAFRRLTRPQTRECAVQTASGETVGALGGRKARLDVHLLTSTRTPVAGAVTISDGTGRTSASTGAAGSLTIALAAGADRTVGLSYPGSNIYPGAMLSLTLRNRAYATVRLVTRRLPPHGPATFAGRVVGSDGTPASLPLKLQYLTARGRWRTVVTLRSQAAGGRWRARVAWPRRGHAGRRGIYFRVVVAGLASGAIPARLPR